jgi:hypothetical protein
LALQRHAKLFKGCSVSANTFRQTPRFRIHCHQKHSAFGKHLQIDPAILMESMLNPGINSAIFSGYGFIAAVCVVESHRETAARPESGNRDDFHDDESIS